MLSWASFAELLTCELIVVDNVDADVSAEAETEAAAMKIKIRKILATDDLLLLINIDNFPLRVSALYYSDEIQSFIKNRSRYLLI